MFVLSLPRAIALCESALWPSKPGHKAMLVGWAVFHTVGTMSFYYTLRHMSLGDARRVLMTQPALVWVLLPPGALPHV